MAARETPAQQIERLLQTGDPLSAARVASELIAKAPTSFLGHLGRCRAHLQLGNIIEAERDLEVALKSSPNDEQACFLRASLDNRYGRAEAGKARLLPLARGRGPHAIEAGLALLDLLHQTSQRDELVEMVKSGGPWSTDPRALMHFARVEALSDPLKAAASMSVILKSAHPIPLRRIAGFEAAGLLDKVGDYRGAFDIARLTHATTGDDFSIDAFLRPMIAQLALVEKGANWIAPRAPHVEGVAMIVSLPRSGTTLLEQMLDRHPAISGIGEFDGMRAICKGLEATGPWPRNQQSVPTERYTALQALYLEGAHRIRREGATWTFDKALRTWRSLPEVAAVLPGAVCLNVERDPRDMATSLFLSYFNAGSVLWTQTFENMRRVIDMERTLVGRAMNVLGIKHETIIYEDLVEDPAAHAQRCLALMNLPMDERVLAPQENTRAAITLSALQVRKPINRSSIGRWKNYDFAFDASWDALVQRHEAQRRSISK